VEFGEEGEGVLKKERILLMYVCVVESFGWLDVGSLGQEDGWRWRRMRWECECGFGDALLVEVEEEWEKGGKGEEEEEEDKEEVKKTMTKSFTTRSKLNICKTLRCATVMPCSTSFCSLRCIELVACARLLPYIASHRIVLPHNNTHQNTPACLTHPSPSHT